MVSVILIGKDRFEVPSEGTIGSAILSLDRFPDAFLFLVNGVPVPMDTPIMDDIIIKAVKVASGG